MDLSRRGIHNDLWVCDFISAVGAGEKVVRRRITGPFSNGTQRMDRVLLGCFVLGTLTFTTTAYAQNQAASTPETTQDDAKDSGILSPNVYINKSQFDLLNPTPDDDLRPFSTDRPGKTHSSLTVDAGHFQLEGDFWNYTWDNWSKDGTKTRAFTVVNPNLKLGITNWAELDIFLPLYNSLEIKSRNGAGVLRAHGFGDILLGGKVNIFGNDGGDQALGAIGFIKVPTAAGGLGNNMIEYMLNIPFTTALHNKFSLTVEPAVALLRNQNNQGYQGDYQMLINLNRPIIGDVVTAAIELALDFPGDHNIGPRHTIDPSLQWLVTPNLQLDVGVYIGLTKAAPDWNPYVGISFRY